MGTLKGAGHRDTAEAFLAFLASPEGQQVYAKYGFVNGTADDLKPKPIE
ncbi:MAG: substrate-binding domain-containing protein [Candidatus Binataceae bacterium]